MQAHARVCEENKFKKMMPIETILWLKKWCKFEGSYTKSGEVYQDDILINDSP